MATLTEMQIEIRDAPALRVMLFNGEMHTVAREDVLSGNLPFAASDVVLLGKSNRVKPDGIAR